MKLRVVAIVSSRRCNCYIATLQIGALDCECKGTTFGKGGFSKARQYRAMCGKNKQKSYSNPHKDHGETSTMVTAGYSCLRMETISLLTYYGAPKN